MNNDSVATLCGIVLLMGAGFQYLTYPPLKPVDVENIATLSASTVTDDEEPEQVIQLRKMRAEIESLKSAEDKRRRDDEWDKETLRLEAARQRRIAQRTRERAEEERLLLSQQAQEREAKLAAAFREQQLMVEAARDGHTYIPHFVHRPSHSAGSGGPPQTIVLNQ